MPVADDFEALLESPSEDGYKRHVERLRSEIHDLRREIARRAPESSSPKPRTHLVIGDSHSDPDVPNDRYVWLGKLVREVRPDVVVDIGDWADMGSLSSYDKGKRSFEGRRYHKDVDHAIKAREVFHRELRGLRYKPRLIHTRGNHEHRIDKATDEQPALDGLISTDDLKVKDFGWEEHPFMVPAFADGIAYCHYFASGVMSRPIGGMHLASALLRLGFMSCVQGHSHTYDHAERTRVDGSKVLGLSVGCYFGHYMSWAGSQANAMYYRGIVVIREVESGYGQVEKISYETIRRKHG